MAHPIPMPTPNVVHLVFPGGDTDPLAKLEARLRELEAKVDALDAPKAYNKTQAAKKLGVSSWKVWQLCSTGELKQTAYGTIPATEIDRHLAEAAK